MTKGRTPIRRSALVFLLATKNLRRRTIGAGGETRTLMRSEPRQILSLVRIPISPLRLEGSAQAILDKRAKPVNLSR